MTEQQLTDNIVELCKYLGVLVHHDRPSRTEHGWRTAVQGDAGFPDLVIVSYGGVLFREVKTNTGQLTGPQKEWLARLARAGADAGVWRERDWPERIRTEIEGITRGQ